MRRRGITLLEVLVVVGISALIAGSISRAFAVSLSARQRLDAAHLRDQKRIAFERKLSSLLQGAEVTASATNEASFFIGTDSVESLSNPGGLASTSTTLAFTTFGGPLPNSVVNSSDDFETLNEQKGPQGGVTEVVLSTTPTGDAGDKNGLFLREQTPADGDPSQGGYESLLSPDVSSIQFEFFDGSIWDTAWDTRTQQGVRRIPAAVRITYSLTSDPDSTNHVIVVRLRNSDVTVDNPITQTGATTP